MQEVTWSDLPMLSQHVHFYPATQAILEYSQALHVFHPLDIGPDLDFHATPRDLTLLDHAMRRNRISCPPSSTTGSRMQSDADRSYPARHLLDPDTAVQAEFIAYDTSRRVQRGRRDTAYTAQDIMALLEGWGDIGTGSNVSLSYSRYWLAPSLGSDWLSLYQLCQQSSSNPTLGNEYNLLFSLCAYAYSHPDRKDVSLLLLALATNQSQALRHDLSRWSSYTLSDGYEPDQATVARMIRSSALSIFRSPGDTNKMFKSKKREHETNVQTVAHRSAQLFIQRWPEIDLSLSTIERASWSKYIDGASALEKIRGYFQSCSANTAFRTHIQRVEATLRKPKPTSVLPRIRYRLPPTLSMTSSTHSPVSLSSLLCSRVAPFSANIGRVYSLAHALTQPWSVAPSNSISLGTDELDGLLALFRSDGSNPLLRAYAADLETSLQALRSEPRLSLPEEMITLDSIQVNRDRCATLLEDALLVLQRALSPASAIDAVLSLSGLWPRLTPRSLLRFLDFKHRSSLPTSWSQSLTTYAQVFIGYQRAQRLLGCRLHDRAEELSQELDNNPSYESRARNDPDWLLIQVSICGDLTRRLLMRCLRSRSTFRRGPCSVL